MKALNRITPTQILVALILAFSSHVALSVATGFKSPFLSAASILLDAAGLFVCLWLLVGQRNFQKLRTSSGHWEEQLSHLRKEKGSLRRERDELDQKMQLLLQRVKDLEEEVEKQHLAREIYRARPDLRDSLPKTLCLQADHILRHTGAQEVTVFLISQGSGPVAHAQARPGKTFYGMEVRFSSERMDVAKVKDALDTGQTMMTSNYETQKGIQEVLITAPILYDGAPLGGLTLAMKIDPGEEPPVEKDVVAEIAERLGTCIHNHKLYEKAITDGLTSLYGHAYFEDVLQQLMETQKKTDRTFSLVMFDIDHFKAFNDHYGHQTGDEVLREVARLSREAVGERGSAFRYGGEEMAFLLPMANATEALKFAEVFRKTIAKHVFKSTEGKDLRVMISLGVSESTLDMKDPAELVAQADKALYASKEGGRNKATLYQHDSEVASVPVK